MIIENLKEMTQQKEKETNNNILLASILSPSKKNIKEKARLNRKYQEKNIENKKSKLNENNPENMKKDIMER